MNRNLISSMMADSHRPEGKGGFYDHTHGVHATEVQMGTVSDNFDYPGYNYTHDSRLPPGPASSTANRSRSGNLHTR